MWGKKALGSTSSTTVTSDKDKEKKGVFRSAWNMMKRVAIVYTAERVGESIYEAMTDSTVTWDIDLKNKHFGVDVTDNHVIQNNWVVDPNYVSDVSNAVDTNDVSSRGYEEIVTNDTEHVSDEIDYVLS